MQLDNGNISLILSLDPFQLTFTRAGQFLLRSAPDPQPATVTQTDSGLQVDFPTCALSIAPAKDGFRLQASGDFRLAFELSGHWFGHGELLHQRLPLERLMLPLSPFETYDNGPAGQSCKLTPAWYSSTGALVMAHSPVSVGSNQPPEDFPRYNWTLGAEKGPFAHRPFMDEENQGDGLLTLAGKDLHLNLYFASDAVSAYQSLIGQVGHPTQTPPAELFAKPTWTTWARYKTAVSQEGVLKFAGEIIENKYPYGVLEIDDRWQSHYGDISFDPVRFPEPKGMIDQLHEKGFKVTAWVIPFLDPDSAAFAEGASKNFLVRRLDGSPYLVPWWQGRGGLLDVTNPSALAWFLARLRRLQVQTGLDGYKFDAGEACFLPVDAVTHQTIHPNEYTHLYVDFVGRHFSLTEVRSGWLNQRSPIFFRQWDKWTAWGADNGLHSVLTGILALGLTGYPFILPDMVGGNAYDTQADAELMIRWTQLNALLPAMQFSLALWDYGDACNEICRRYADLHTEFAPRIIKVAAEAARSGAPIIRPLWWLAPPDEKFLLCDDQFLLGNDILVAPVLYPNVRKRDILLPPGQWRDHWNGQIFEGDTTLSDYPSPLHILPLFERVKRFVEKF
jgi:myogenesis-regulating glycosidase